MPSLISRQRVCLIAAFHSLCFVSNTNPCTTNKHHVRFFPLNVQKFVHLSILFAALCCVARGADPLGTQLLTGQLLVAQNGN
jgi:hypothetical protein